METRQVIDTILGRAMLLGLTTSPGHQVDASAVELLVLQTVQGLAETFDLDFLTVITERMFSTQTGERRYTLPSDFGRFVTPRDDNESGLLLSNGTNESPLRYREPLIFRQQQSTTNNRPGYFTLVNGPAVLLDPPPDANSGTPYTGTGVYILAVTPALLDQDWPIPQASCLVDMVLGMFASDSSHPQSQLLFAKGEQARARLLNATVRQRQQFQSKTGRLAHDTRHRFTLR